MKSFKVSEHLEIVCEFKKTRSGFKHEATLLRDGAEVDKTKCCYQNRTWERYEFESVLRRIVEKTTSLTEEERQACKKIIEKDHTDYSGFNTVAMVAKMGEVLCSSDKDKNEWKTRMLRAGLGGMGLEIPADWDSLDEETKKARLDAVIKTLGQVGKEESK